MRDVTQGRHTSIHARAAITSSNLVQLQLLEIRYIKSKRAFSRSYQVAFQRRGVPRQER